MKAYCVYHHQAYHAAKNVLWWLLVQSAISELHDNTIKTWDKIHSLKFTYFRSNNDKIQQNYFVSQILFDFLARNDNTSIVLVLSLLLYYHYIIINIIITSVKDIIDSHIMKLSLLRDESQINCVLRNTSWGVSDISLHKRHRFF